VICSQEQEVVSHYQEHAQRVKRQRKRVEAGTVQPDFGIAHRSRDILPRDALISHGIAVCGETSSNELFLFWRDEGGLGWPVHHVPVCGDAEKNGKYALDDKDPSAFWSVVKVQTSDADISYLQPLKPPTPLM
jgi:hypothetical protein